MWNTKGSNFSPQALIQPENWHIMFKHICILWLKELNQIHLKIFKGNFRLEFQFLFHLYSLEKIGGGGSLVSKSCPTLATPWTVACQAPLSMRFSRQEYWVGCHSLLQGSSSPSDWTRTSCGSCVAGCCFTAEPHRNPHQCGCCCC